MAGVGGGTRGKEDVCKARLTSGEDRPLLRVWGCQGSGGVACFGVEHECLGEPNLSFG